MSDNIYKLYNIDKSQLLRDYLKNPLKITSNGVNSEKPYKEDLKYLYIELNLSKNKLNNYFNTKNLSRWLKIYNIKKPKELIVKNIKNTNLIKYGTENPFQNQKIKNQIKQICFQKYGNENYRNVKQMKETNLQKYNHICSLYSQQVKEKIKQKYDVDYYVQSKDFKEKQYITKKKNNSFNKSKSEEIYYNKLIEKYGVDDIIRQHKSELYPYNCDFYIKSKNLYIEYNGNWTHGFEPYNQNNIEHNNLLNKWKEKVQTSNYYKQAIYVWTKSDVYKRKTALKNKLNYIEVWK